MKQRKATHTRDKYLLCYYVNEGDKLKFRGIVFHGNNLAVVKKKQLQYKERFNTKEQIDKELIRNHYLIEQNSNYGNHGYDPDIDVYRSESCD